MRYLKGKVKKKRQLIDYENDMMTLTSAYRKYRLDMALDKQKDNIAYNPLNKKLTIVEPAWRTAHDSTVKKLVPSLTKFSNQQINSLLKLEKLTKTTSSWTQRLTQCSHPCHRLKHIRTPSSVLKIWNKLTSIQQHTKAIDAHTIWLNMRRILRWWWEN